jgi:hypothetical protein
MKKNRRIKNNELEEVVRKNLPEKSIMRKIIYKLDFGIELIKIEISLN